MEIFPWKRGLKAPRDSTGCLWNAVPENGGKMIPMDLGKGSGKLFTTLALQDIKCFSFCRVEFASRGEFWRSLPLFCPFFLLEHPRKLLASARFPDFLFPRCNLLKILLPLGILGCFRFPWPIRSLVELKLFLWSHKRLKCNRRNLLPERVEKLPLLWDAPHRIRWQEKGREIKRAGK